MYVEVLIIQNAMLTKIMKRQISLGVKLTCGLEILARFELVIGIIDLIDLLNLFKEKYFKNTLVGSKEYNNFKSC